jgi:subtilisin-like proprotein convertase family protein
MKRSMYLMTFLLMAALSLLACLVASGPGGGGEQWKVEVQVSGPIALNSPVTATLIVTIPENIPNMLIGIDVVPPYGVVVEGPQEWVVDTIANQPITHTTTFRFTQEGYFGFIGAANNPRSGARQGATRDLHVTQTGGTLDPTPIGPRSIVTPTVTYRPPPATRSAPKVVTFDFTSRPNVPIPEDGTCLTYTFPITTAPTDASVLDSVGSLLITHPRPQDLIVELVGSDGTTVRRVWDRKTPSLKDFEAGYLVIGIPKDSFRGQRVNGNWVLRLCDEAPGEVGTLHAYSFIIVQQLGASRATSTPANTSTASVTLLQAPQGSWQVITNEPFENWGSGPFRCWSVDNPCWTATDLNNVGNERVWQRATYRPYGGNWAIWPAAGGTYGIDPAQGDHDYPNNMNTRLIYGPFDLSDAVRAKVEFALWLEIEKDYDYLTLEISRDGITFDRLFTWSGTGAPIWDSESISFDEYVGDDSIWLAWRFYSDASVTYDGPWIDDVQILKQVAGAVTASGNLYYYNRVDNFNRAPAPGVRMTLYDSNPGGNDRWLGESQTDANGAWTIGPILNQDDPRQYELDLYTVFALSEVDGFAWWRVTNTADTIYQWDTLVQSDVADGIVSLDFTVDGTNINQPAMWLFQDMRRATQYLGW